VPTPLAAARAGTTHADLALPFNLSLTDAQRAQRGAVPLPYAHEGEGADVRMGMDWSDDEEDDEV
jgi:elongator complex protein 5